MLVHEPWEKITFLHFKQVKSLDLVTGPFPLYIPGMYTIAKTNLIGR